MSKYSGPILRYEADIWAKFCPVLNNILKFFAVIPFRVLQLENHFITFHKRTFASVFLPCLRFLHFDGFGSAGLKQSRKFNNRTEIKFDVTNTQDKKIYQLPMLICVIATLDCLLTPKCLIVFRRHYGVNYSKAKQCVSLKQCTKDCTVGGPVHFTRFTVYTCVLQLV